MPGNWFYNGKYRAIPIFFFELKRAKLFLTNLSLQRKTWQSTKSTILLETTTYWFTFSVSNFQGHIDQLFRLLDFFKNCFKDIPGKFSLKKMFSQTKFSSFSKMFFKDRLGEKLGTFFYFLPRTSGTEVLHFFKYSRFK